MNNRLVILAVLFTLAGQGALMSQGLTFRAGAAYRLGKPSLTLGENSEYYSYSPYSGSSGYYSTAKSDIVVGTYGQGMSLEAGIGYQGDFFGIDLGVIKTAGSAIEYASKDTYESQTTPTTVTRSESNYFYKFESSILALNPTIVFGSANGLYAKVGAVVAFPKISAQRRRETLSTGNYDQTTEYSGGTAIGYSGAIGLAFGGTGFQFCLEADVISLTWGPEESEVTAYTVDGVDKLPTMTVADKKTIYEETFTYDSREYARNPDAPSHGQKYYVPMHTIGLKVGLRIVL